MTKILLIGLLILVVALSGCLQDNEIVQDNEIEFCKGMRSLQAGCVSEIAIKRNDVGVCSAAFCPTGFCISGEDSVNRQDCIKFYVEGTGDAEACNLMQYEDSIQNCKLGAIAKNPDPKICEQISETFYRNNCYYDLAEKHGLSQYCNYIDENCEKDTRCRWLKQGCFMAVEE